MNTTKELKKENLEALAPGESGVILRVGNEKGPVKRRLVDMGLTPGTEVTVRKIAPFGDPIEVNLRGYELSLRKEDARQIILATGEEAQECGTAHKKRVSMVQRLPDEETLRRMSAAHAHEAAEHGGTPDYASHDTREIKMALVGNPNCGKTTLFNALTGSNQYVGNWPGVTVEKKEGTARLQEGKAVTIVDLPGIYSLSPYSMEEIVARDFIVAEHPDAIIDIVDATNIERNLYLTVQLLELERPMVIALNFMDEARKHGDQIDCERLSRELGVPVIPITARTGENIQELLEAAHRQIHAGVTMEPDDLYDDYTHRIHHQVGALIHDRAYAAGIPAHWASVKLIEGDELVEKSLALDWDTKEKLEDICREYEGAYALGDRETLIADARYQYIQRSVGAAVKKGMPSGELTTSDKIDSIVTNKYLAIPVFLLMMLAMFSLTFGPGQMLSDGVEALVGMFGEWLGGLLAAIDVAPWVISLLVDGVVAGVGGVLVFLPQIALLFLFLSVLEDSGYMARAAFIMDRLLRRFGLSGKAFIPMLMGFGCTVPAVMGARTMENEKDRRMTIMLAPFMSCSARLPVYGLIAGAFFARYSGLVVFSLYVIGLLFAILSGVILKKTMFKGEPAAFVLELPPYRLPTFKNCAMHVWEKVRGFLVKAGTLILAMSVVLWFLQSFGWDGGVVMVDNAGKSFLGAVGSFIAPALKPLGFGTWQAAVALLAGLVAKEAVVSSMSLFYGFSVGASGTVVASALSGTFATPAAAYAFLVFVLLYVPCVAAVSTIRKEMNSTKWTVRSILWQIGAAYIGAFLAYHIGLLLC